jgi:copper(I)-binding protein
MIKRLLLIGLLVFALPVSAENLQITDARIKNLPTVVPVRAGYMKISNKQSRTITILSLESNAFESIKMASRACRLSPACPFGPVKYWNWPPVVSI